MQKTLIKYCSNCAFRWCQPLSTQPMYGDQTIVGHCYICGEFALYAGELPRDREIMKKVEKENVRPNGSHGFVVDQVFKDDEKED